MSILQSSRASGSNGSHQPALRFNRLASTPIPDCVGATRQRVWNLNCLPLSSGYRGFVYNFLLPQHSRIEMRLRWRFLWLFVQRSQEPSEMTKPSIPERSSSSRSLRIVDLELTHASFSPCECDLPAPRLRLELSRARGAFVESVNHHSHPQYHVFTSQNLKLFLPADVLRLNRSARKSETISIAVALSSALLLMMHGVERLLSGAPPGSSRA